jgi:cytochrome c-type biogenesis protein CcmE
VAEVERDPLEIPREEESGGKSHLIRFFLLWAVVALAVGYMVYAAFPGSTRYFLTVSEFMSGEQYQDGQMLRVSGKLVAGSFQRQEGSTLSHFRLTDKNNVSATHMDASYVGVLPDLFFNPHSEIILEGSYSSDNVFEADNILVKCPSKYRSLEEQVQQQQAPTSG